VDLQERGNRKINRNEFAVKIEKPTVEEGLIDECRRARPAPYLFLKPLKLVLSNGYGYLPCYSCHDRMRIMILSISSLPRIPSNPSMALLWRPARINSTNSVSFFA
jgi:hypothetical protein